MIMDHDVQDILHFASVHNLLLYVLLNLSGCQVTYLSLLQTLVTSSCQT